MFQKPLEARCMKFTIDRVKLIRLLKVVSTSNGVCKREKSPLLRIQASDGILELSFNNTDAGCEAIVESSGVCFLRHAKFKQLLQTYHSDHQHKSVIDIEVTPTAIRIGRTEINREGWEISLFQNPDMAPRKLTFLKPIPEEESEAHTQIEISFEPSADGHSKSIITLPSEPVLEKIEAEKNAE